MTPFHKLRRVPTIGQRMLVVHNGTVYDGAFESFSAANNGHFVVRTVDLVLSVPGTALVRIMPEN